MDHKLRPVHALGAVVAFAVGFLFVTAVSAYAGNLKLHNLPASSASSISPS